MVSSSVIFFICSIEICLDEVFKISSYEKTGEKTKKPEGLTSWLEQKICFA